MLDQTSASWAEKWTSLWNAFVDVFAYLVFACFGLDPHATHCVNSRPVEGVGERFLFSS